MAVEYIAWALKQKVGNATAKGVLVVLANYADEDGFTFVSQKVMAAATELNIRSIQRALKTLSDNGFITKEPRYRVDGSRTTDGIKLHVTNCRMAERQSDEGDATDPTKNDDTESGQLTVNNRQSNNKKNKTKKVTLPDWIDPEDWKDFEELRKKKKKPLTDRARKLAIGELQKIHDSGLSVKTAIERTILNGWLSFYPPHGTSKSAGSDQPLNPQQSKHRQESMELLGL